jgi:hypothetical protein
VGGQRPLPGFLERWLARSRSYETPFIDFSSRGVEGLFNPEQVTQLISILDNVRDSAVA